jgi:radical SAM protein with 4Fe4S-binding SPASM domain
MEASVVMVDSASLLPLASVNGTLAERIDQATGLTLEEFERHFRSKPASKIVQVSIHNRCNQSCTHCFQIEGDSISREVTPHQILEVLGEFGAREYRRFLFPREPLLLPHLFRVYELAGCTEMSTNLTVLANQPEMLELLRQHRIRTLFVSLHGNQRQHCELTRVGPRIYDDLIRSLRMISDSGLDLEIITVLYKKNIGALDSLPELLMDIGVSKWWIQRIMPAGLARNWPLSAFFHLSWGPNFYSQGMLQFLAGQVERWPWTRFACPAASGDSIVISMDSGKAYQCLFLESFAEARIGEVERDMSAVVDRHHFVEDTLMARLRGRCGECTYKRYCLGGCRAMAFSFAHMRGESDPFFAGQDYCLTNAIDEELRGRSTLLAKS